MKTRALSKIEEAARSDWRRAWGKWWHGLKDGVPDRPRAVMDWALAHHCEGDSFDREAKAAVQAVTPDRGDWTELREWADTLHEETAEVLEHEDLGTRPSDLPAPPFVPTGNEYQALIRRAERTPEGVAAALFARTAYTARYHDQFLTEQ